MQISLRRLFNTRFQTYTSITLFPKVKLTPPYIAWSQNNQLVLFSLKAAIVSNNNSLLEVAARP